MRPGRAVGDDGGFTLVELLVVITITSLLGGVVLTSVVRGLDITRTTTDRVEALTTVQRAQERMSRLIRAADPLRAATGTSVEFDVYRDGDRELITLTYDATTESITQSTVLYSPATAATGVTQPATTVVEGLDQDTTQVFSFTGTAGSSLPTPVVEADVRSVGITLRMAIEDARPLVMTTGVFLRNSVLEDDL